jgi:putative glutamine amidotransferase
MSEEKSPPPAQRAATDDPASASNLVNQEAAEHQAAVPPPQPSGTEPHPELPPVSSLAAPSEPRVAAGPVSSTDPAVAVDLGNLIESTDLDEPSSVSTVALNSADATPAVPTPRSRNRYDTVPDLGSPPAPPQLTPVSGPGSGPVSGPIGLGSSGISGVGPFGSGNSPSTFPGFSGGSMGNSSSGASNSGMAPPAYLKTNDSAWSVFGRTLAARARLLFDRAGQRITQRTLKIGVSARIFHPEPSGKGLRGKTLQYLEESIAHWVMSRDVLVFMIPTVGHQGMLHPSNIRLRDYAKHLDGLVLQGGADVSPQSYAEQATSHEWPGDRVRDMYELELLHEFIESGKPVLGVCRGCQLINVAFGGSLYQDIATDVPTALEHVNDQYDQHRHSIRFPAGSTLSSMFAGQGEALVNSIHHQAVKTVGRDLNVEAVSADDGIIEAIRYRKAPFVMGVQWHPEFHVSGGAEMLDCTPILDTFLRVARETRF